MAASWVLSSVALATLLTMVEISLLCLARERSDRSCDDYRYFEGGLLTVFVARERSDRSCDSLCSLLILVSPS